MKLFPAKISEPATLQNLWRQKETVYCYPQMFTLARFIFINLCTKKFFLVDYVTNHLKTGPLGNSWFCFPSISMFSEATGAETSHLVFNMPGWLAYQSLPFHSFELTRISFNNSFASILGKSNFGWSFSPFIICLNSRLASYFRCQFSST